MNECYYVFGENVKKDGVPLGLIHERLAEMASIYHMHISDAEQSKRNISLKNIQK